MEELHLLVDARLYMGEDFAARSASIGKILIEYFPVTHLYVGETEGIEVLQWALDNECAPEFIQCVSPSREDQANIANMLLNWEYHKDGRFWRKKEQV